MQLPLDPAHSGGRLRGGGQQHGPQREEHDHRAAWRRPDPCLRGGRRSGGSELRGRGNPGSVTLRRPPLLGLRHSVSNQCPVTPLRGGAAAARPPVHGRRRSALLRSRRDPECARLPEAPAQPGGRPVATPNREQAGAGDRQEHDREVPGHGGRARCPAARRSASLRTKRLLADGRQGLVLSRADR